MKATSKSEPAKTLGFWTRLGRAVAVPDMTPPDFLELRIERLENQVARLMGARERRSGSTFPTQDER
jgi:hypothetical protein